MANIRIRILCDSQETEKFFLKSPFLPRVEKLGKAMPVFLHWKKYGNSSSLRGDPECKGYGQNDGRETSATDGALKKEYFWRAEFSGV